MSALRAVVDTNVLAGALLRSEGRNRAVLRACFLGQLHPVIGEALFLEYEDVLGRDALFRRSPLSKAERLRLFEAFLSTCEWVEVYYRWRPNLRDEADNHLIELAVAAQASVIITNNIADFSSAALRFPVRILSPGEVMKEVK